MLMEFVIFMAFSIQFSAPENPSMHPVPPLDHRVVAHLWRSNTRKSARSVPRIFWTTWDLQRRRLLPSHFPLFISRLLLRSYLPSLSTEFLQHISRASIVSRPHFISPFLCCFIRVLNRNSIAIPCPHPTRHSICYLLSIPNSSVHVIKIATTSSNATTNLNEPSSRSQRYRHQQPQRFNISRPECPVNAATLPQVLHR